MNNNSSRARWGKWSVAGLLIAIGTGAAADGSSPMGLADVKVRGKIGEQIDATIQENLLKLNVDRDFISPFLGAPESRSGAYIGLGKLIDASVHFATYTDDPRVLALKQHLVNGALKAQEADGYIGTHRPVNRTWKLWDAHEMSYLILGLTTDYRDFGEKPSLRAARRLADYLISHWTREPNRNPGAEEYGGLVDYLSVIGVESAMLSLSDATGDLRYRRFCEDFRHLREWHPFLKPGAGAGGHRGAHVYANVARTLAQLELYQAEPDPRLLASSNELLEFLTHCDAMVVTGECGYNECWDESQDGTMDLGETCATAYLIRWLDTFERIDGRAICGDLMERLIYNALFAAQSPGGRDIRYFTPFDGPRRYYDKDTFCCPNNYRRIVSELPSFIYHQRNGGLAINLYADSRATIEITPGLSVGVSQSTDYPNNENVEIEITPSHAAQFPIWARMPRWCADPVVSINDGKSIRATAGDFLLLDRKWQAGDRIKLRFPMPWRLVKGRQAQAGRVVLMRGPMVFGLSREKNPSIANLDLRLLVLDQRSPAVTSKDLGSGGLPSHIEVKAWAPGAVYPVARPSLTLTLTEFVDPSCESIYFKVPDPSGKALVDDELVGGAL